MYLYGQSKSCRFIPKLIDGSKEEVIFSSGNVVFVVPLVDKAYEVDGVLVLSVIGFFLGNTSIDAFII